MNAEKRENVPMPHTLSMRDRRQLEMRGVTDVVSFDEESAELTTVCGNLSIEGTGLHVKVLNLSEGIVTFDGTVNALIYTDSQHPEKKEKSGLFGKWFH